MKIGRYYRQIWAPVGVDVDILEKSLGEWLEAKTPAVIDKLIETHETPTEEELTVILLYIELQRIRVPRQAASALDLMRSAVVNGLPEQIATLVGSGVLEVEMKDTARFDYMRIAIGSIHPWMARMEWEVIRAEPGSEFLTTDSPICFYNPSVLPPAEAGIALAGTTVLFPLSSTHMLLMRHPECRSHAHLEVLPEPNWERIQVRLDRGTVWPQKTVASTNWKMAMLAHEVIAAANPDLLRATGWKGSASAP